MKIPILLAIQFIPVVDCVALGIHCEYQALLYWHVDGAQQSVSPVYWRPPHWPYWATHGATQSTAFIQMVMWTISLTRLW